VQNGQLKFDDQIKWQKGTNTIQWSTQNGRPHDQKDDYAHPNGGLRAWDERNK